MRFYITYDRYLKKHLIVNLDDLPRKKEIYDPKEIEGQTVRRCYTDSMGDIIFETD